MVWEAPRTVYLGTLKFTCCGFSEVGDSRAAQPMQGTCSSQFCGRAEAICFDSSSLCSQNSWLEPKGTAK